MKTILQFIMAVLLLTIPAVLVHADGTHPRGIRLDGTLGSAGQLDLPGPDYEIRAEHGHQAGPNLFHSFHQFNIHSNESATFTGPDSVRNIISRVTDGNASWIDGELVSAISGADLYLLNPAGVMFGPNASLDLSGSFHVSTADYLRLGENERFDSRLDMGGVLSVAAPAAFGFLDGDVSDITFEGRGEIAAENWDGVPAGLTVPEGEAISVVGGDIEMRNGTYLTTTLAVPNPADLFGDPIEVPRISPLGSLNAPEGRINLVSAASGGEVVPTESGPDTSSLDRLGRITVSERSLLDVSGEGAGSMFIRAGQFVASDSGLHARTLGDRDGHGIFIDADDTRFTAGAYLDGNTYGAGKGGDVTLRGSGSVTFEGENSLGDVSKILLETHSKDETAGKAGALVIEAGDISLEDGAAISSITFGKGDGGNVTLRARDTIGFSGQNRDFYHTMLSLGFFGEYRAYHAGGVFSLISSESNGGHGGDVLLDAGDISLTNGCSIYSTTLGPGSSGDISVRASGTVSITDSGGENFWAGAINSTAFTPGTGAVVGNAGNISLDAGKLILRDGCYVASASNTFFEGMQSGKAGDVTIRVAGELCMSGVNPHGFTYAYIGDKIPGGTDISARARGIGSGEAGDIRLEAGSLVVENGATISADTSGTSKGGNIDIQVRDSVRVSGGALVKTYTTEDQYTETYIMSRIDASSYNVSADAGSGGKISLSAREVILTDGGRISTLSEGGGDAGDISLYADQVRLDNNALVSSASTSETHGGAAGTVLVDADSVSMTDHSAVTTDAVSAGGGKISVSADSLLYLSDSEMTTSVREGGGKGGDIDISGSQSVVLNNGNVRANAQAGDGGAIFIHAGTFLKSSDSRVTATSARGNEGTVDIDSPDTDVSSALTVMPQTYLNAEKWAKTPCEHRSAENMSRFVIRQKDAAPMSDNDWQPLLSWP